MKYIDLRARLGDFILLSINDFTKIDPEFHKQRLSEWQKKGYIKKVTNQYYIFSDLVINESVLFIIANGIYQPSYVSLEMALSYYGLIPESVYAVTSVTSRVTKKLKSKISQFSYKKIKPELMFGYKLVTYRNQNFKIAEIEKAILDYFYSNSRLKSDGDFGELRINIDSFNERVDFVKLRNYLARFNSKTLEKRVNKFLKFIPHA